LAFIWQKKKYAVKCYVERKILFIIVMVGLDIIWCVPWLASYKISWENKRYASFFSISVTCNLRACVLLDIILYMYCACINPVFLYTFPGRMSSSNCIRSIVSTMRSVVLDPRTVPHRISVPRFISERSDYKLQINKKFYLLHFVIYF